MPSSRYILVINPGSTSTKLGIYENECLLMGETIRHSVDELARFSDVWHQYPHRLKLCRAWLKHHTYDFHAVVGVGGLLRPLDGGVYRVNQQMLEDARANSQGEHASNLGCALAFELALEHNSSAFVVDPVSVDEFEPLAYYSGHPSIKRRSLSHALNIHAVARWAANELNIAFNDSSFVVGHLGGGISIAAVRGGKIIDVNDAASDGPFSAERTGGLPLQQFISLCFDGTHSEKCLRITVMGNGGLVAYLNTNSTEEVEKRIRTGDSTACEVYEAMAYQIAKEIGAMSTVLKGKLDAIVLTGGCSRSVMLTTWIKERTHHLAPVLIHPSDDEMQSLAAGALRALQNEEHVKEY